MREERGDGEECPDDGRDIQTERREDPPVASDVSDERMDGRRSALSCSFSPLNRPQAAERALRHRQTQAQQQDPHPVSLTLTPPVQWTQNSCGQIAMSGKS